MSSNNSNQLVNPQAREAMDRFKMEAASEVGVNLKQGYNGDLTSRQAGSIGGQMVKKKCPTRNSSVDGLSGHMTRSNCPTRTLSFRRASRISDSHEIDVNYIFSISL